MKRSSSSTVMSVLLFVPILFIAFGCTEEPPAQTELIRPVKTIRVSSFSNFGETWFPGRAKAHKEVDLSFRVSGPLIARPVDVGDQVKKGALIARIDPRDFQVTLRTAQGRLDRAKAEMKRAESDFRRITRIRRQDPGATSATKLDETREALEASKAVVRSLLAEVDNAQDQLSYTYIRAPFTGTIVSTYVESFEDVRAKQPIARLLDSSRVEMVIDLPENTIHLAPYAKNIVVKFDAFPGEVVPATIHEVGKEATQTTRTYPVTLIMNQPSQFTILPGMAGKAAGEVRLPDGEKEKGVFTIPIAAVFSRDDPEKSYVWVVDEQNMMVQQREITSGDLRDHGIEIMAGLVAGELIVAAGVNSLHEGQVVTLLPDQAELYE